MMTGQKILVAEDDAVTRQLLEFKLKQLGCAVVSARDGEEAMKLAQVEKPVLIILDCLMPVIDGFEVLRRLKESPELRKIPVLMLTVKAKDNDIVTCLELGAEDYMTKPFSPAELVARVRKILRLQAGPGGR